MSMKQRLKNLELRLSTQRNISANEPKSIKLMDIPKETWIGAYKILIEAGVISTGDYPGSPDQFANQLYQGTITEANCLADRNGHYDLSRLSDEQLTSLENLYSEAGTKQ